MVKRKNKSNRRKRGGGAGGNGEKKQMEMAKQKYCYNQRTSSLEPDPFQDNQQPARQLEVLGGFCVKEVEGDGNCCFLSLSDQVGLLLAAAFFLLQYIPIPYIFTVITSSMVSH